ncbi:caspase family protein [Geobacter hydrogenophilus]|uniref:Peptidase C14 n=1 Tax=Geobacter hydrogenophilus TaxID=40983 RepID=A0A9W6FXZ8_9BACT|nr:caspase family protein [Geobacter hydrogenophilus]MBT0895049.1 caspase family protein [Geobacter hydrogenophilus]GLI36873.1 hypothetical protein GHYDROH2_03740 [Geobacter hydrogenophilus]
MKALRLLPLLLWMVLCQNVISARAAQHALLIGISDYGGTGFRNLDGTLNDVELVRGMLKDRFGFAESDIRVLTNAAANHSSIQKAFADLAARVKEGDFVYIQYSGHGSRTPDLNGDEKPRFSGDQPLDSTWVSFGARVKAEGKGDARGGMKDADNYDILDDELGEWLAPIYRKTANVAFVSDSCHSGSMTRGEAPKTRAIPVDMRRHPLGERKFALPVQAGVRIGAARDDQEAGEFPAPDGKSYGLFTWHWVQALYQSSPGDTWDDVFKRTVALIGKERETRQHPQIEGEIRRSAFDGSFPPPVLSIPVTDVLDDGKAVTLKAGKFTGMTIGSTFRKKGGAATLVITSVQPFASTADVTAGTFKAGDLVVEETHVYPFEPLRVFVRADLGQDSPVAAILRDAVTGIPGYAPATSQKEADLLLLVIRPKRQGDQYVKETPNATLPQPDPAAQPEIWVLAPDERPTRENLRISASDPKRARELVTENLRKMAKVREIRSLGEKSGGGGAAIELMITRYVPDKNCTGDGCLDVPDEKAKGLYRKVGTFPAHQMQEQQLSRGDILTLSVRNNSTTDLYCYLIDITQAGKIEAIYPKPENSASEVLVSARTTRDFADVAGLIIEEPGQETLKVIASQVPLDVSLFEQGGYRTRGAMKGGANPLEDYLANAMGGRTRGSGVATNSNNARWGAASAMFEVR